MVARTGRVEGWVVPGCHPPQKNAPKHDPAPANWPFPTWLGQPRPRPKRRTKAQELADLPEAPY